MSDTSDTSAMGPISIPSEVPVIPIEVPRTREEIRVYRNAQKAENNKKKDAMFVFEETLNKSHGNKYVLACKECKYKLDVKRNFNAGRFHCVWCGHDSSGINESDVPNEKWNKAGFPYVRKTKFFMEIQKIEKKTQTVYRANDKGQVVKDKIEVDKVIRRNTRRHYEEKYNMTAEQVIKQIESVYEDVFKLRPSKDIRNCALLCCLFLTGARVEEITGYQAMQEVICDDGKTRRRVVQGKHELPPLLRKQITREIMTVKGKDVEVLKFSRLNVLKRRKGTNIEKKTYTAERSAVLRNVIIPLNDPIESKFVFYLERHINKIKDPEAIVFRMSRGGAYKIVRRYFDTRYTHYFRHARSSDLSMRKNFDSIRLMKFFGWASGKMAETYSHITDEHLLEEMMIKVD